MFLQINITPDGLIRYPMHKHKNFEIMLYLEGQGELLTERGGIPFASGSIIIVPAGIEHGSVSLDGFKNISIEGDFDRYFCFDSVKLLHDNDSLEGTRLASLIFENRYGDEAYLEALCTAYIRFLLRYFESEGYMKSAVETLIRRISENAFDPNIRLSRILSESGYSEDYIRSCFGRVTGKTPTEYLTDIRIKHACFLIDIYKDTLPLSEIAERCGYLDYVYFSKRFKEAVGVSPRRYKGL